jgi:hypothetical protein
VWWLLHKAVDVGEQRRLDFVAVAHEQIGRPVEPDRWHGLEVHAQKFTEGAAFAQPAPGRHLAARGCHAADQEASDRIALDAVEAEVGEA